MKPRSVYPVVAAAVMLSGVGATQAVAADRTAGAVPVIVNGHRLDSDAVMLRDVNRTVLPMRTLFEALGAHVEWDSAERAVYAWTSDGRGVRLALGSRTAQVLRMDRDPGPGHWGRVADTYPLDAPAMMQEGRIYVPLRFASEALHADVRYAAYEPAVHIRAGQGSAASEDAVADRRRRPSEEDERPPDRYDRNPDRASDRDAGHATDRDRYEGRDSRTGRSRDSGFPGDSDTRRPRVPDDRADRDRRPDRGPESERATRDRAATRDLELSLRVSAGPERSEPTTFELTVRNSGDRSLAIPFATGQQYDLQVLQEGKLVWNWARDRVFTQVESWLTLQPGEERTFRVRWNLRNNRGDRVPSGRYLVRGILTSADRGTRVVVEERITVER